MELRTIIDAFLDINILLALSLGLWFIARRVLIALGLPHAFTTQLRLLQAIFLATLISPLLAAAFSLILSSSPLSLGYSLNLSDIVTAQYLNGSFEMTPIAFESALGLRSRLLSGIEYLDTPLGITLVALFTLGFSIALLRLTLGLRHLRANIADSTLWRRFGTLELRVSDTISIPFSTRTLRRRIIVVPSSLLARQGDLKVALAHEFQHLRQHDLEWEITLELLKLLFFWNPAYLIWKRQFEVLRELSCDQNVLSRRSALNPASYCKSLLNICDSALQPRRIFAVEVPRVTLVDLRKPLIGRGSASLLRQRLISLLDGNKERHPRGMFSVMFAPLFAATIIGAVSIQSTDDWSHDRLMLSTIVNLERLAAHNNAGPTPAINTLSSRPLR